MSIEFWLRRVREHTDTIRKTNEFTPFERAVIMLVAALDTRSLGDFKSLEFMHPLDQRTAAGDMIMRKRLALVPTSHNRNEVQSNRVGRVYFDYIALDEVELTEGDA